MARLYVWLIDKSGVFELVHRISRRRGVTALTAESVIWPGSSIGRFLTRQRALGPLDTVGRELYPLLAPRPMSGLTNSKRRLWFMIWINHVVSR